MLSEFGRTAFLDMSIGGMVGNGRTLAWIVPGGSISAMHSPGIGSSRHVLQSNLGVYYLAEQQFAWLTQIEAQGEQSFAPGTDTLLTEFDHPGGLRVCLHDFVHPDTDVLVRRAFITNLQEARLQAMLFHLEAASVSANREDFSNNIVSFAQGEIVRYRGHPYDNTFESPLSLVIGFEPSPEVVQCGISYQEEGFYLDAFVDVADGRLNGNTYAFHHLMGTISAVGWQIDLASQETVEIAVFYAADYDLIRTRQRISRAKCVGALDLAQDTADWWKTWLDRTPAQAPALQAVWPERSQSVARVGDSRHTIQRWVDQSLTVLRLLQDANTGAFIAAPSVNPDYRYCWPRDASFMAEALSELGYCDEPMKFFEWCAQCQTDDGSWFQNYYPDGRRHWRALQVDQVGTVIWAMCRHLERFDNRPGTALLPCIRRGCEFLLQLVARNEENLVWSEQDLWEETGGYFLYTNAAAVAALREAAGLASRLGQEELCVRWATASEATRQSLLRWFVQDGALVAALNPDETRLGREDYRIDISMLGAVFPFEVLDPHASEVATTLERITSAFQYEVGGVGRYADDDFFGGNPWPLASLWIAHVHQTRGESEQALHYLELVGRRMTRLNYIPEQNDRATGEPASVIPLGWAHAWMLKLIATIGIESLQ